MTKDEMIKELSAILPNDMLIYFLLQQCEVIWIYNIETMLFETWYIDVPDTDVRPEFIKNAALGERIIEDDRRRMIMSLSDTITKANNEKQHVILPAQYTKHKLTDTKYIHTAVSFLVYYNHQKEKATYIIGDTHRAYKKQYEELLLEKLTKRENEYLELYKQGKSQKEISRIMDVESNTISQYKEKIRKKTGMEIDEIAMLVG